MFGNAQPNRWVCYNGEFIMQMKMAMIWVHFII